MKLVKYRYGYGGSATAKRGIENYLSIKYGFHVSEKGNTKKLKKLMIAFLKKSGIEHRAGTTNRDANYNARRIQVNFQKFAEWLKTQYSKDEA